ncbi:MAG: AGE family epimerase/isomerase [Methylobacteriaceae bacterium]|nr:AGE family epimerase/isomerase [Methylobacteriaceae bacterium]
MIETTRELFDIGAARARYVACNAATLRWMLDRGLLGAGFLNTKVNSLTGADYGAEDGLRGPSFTYGWIQGRGLEALTTHAAFFAQEEPALAARLDAAGRRLYGALAGLFERHGAHGYFCYDAELRPIARDGDGRIVPQRAAGDLFTYSDAFVIKGLLAAAARYGDRDGQARWLARLRDLVEAVEDGRFHHQEAGLLDPRPDPSRRDEFGPWMIVLAAAGLLRRLGLADETGFGRRFVDTVLTRHWRGGGGLGLIPDRIGAEAANPGHAIEFVGFAQEASPETDAATAAALERILLACFAAGHRPPGIVVSVDAASGEALTQNRPWWSLPETIRAAALTHARRGSRAVATVWATADADFFAHYWRADRGFAYQTRDAAGPVDFVPATPDLDPGYHTGLSLLGAIEAIDAVAGR